MEFKESSKRGNVLGNDVVARPVPLNLALACMTAKLDAERITALADIVRNCVRMADGSLIDVANLSVNAVAELGKFALEGGGESVADFT